MKISKPYRKILVLCLFLMVPVFIMAQVPKLISYQAVVRDGSTNPLVNSPVNVVMTINQGTPGGAQVFIETHNTTTNQFGLINLRIGDGTGDNLATVDWSSPPYYLNITANGNPMDPVELLSVPFAIYADEAGNVFSGDYNDLSNKPDLGIYLTGETDPSVDGKVADHAAITDSHHSRYTDAEALAAVSTDGYLKNETDPTTDGKISTHTGIADAHHTRYTNTEALAAVAADGYLKDEDDPIFLASDASGITTTQIGNWDNAFTWGDHSTQGYMDSKWDVFHGIVYPKNALRMGLGTDNPGSNMLQIVADPSWGDEDPIFQVVNTQGVPVFTIFNDGSVDVQIRDDLLGKGPKGGFAIGGFSTTKAATQPYLFIDPDSTRLYFNENSAKGPKGGFAIGGFNESKGIYGKYMEVVGERGTVGNNVFLGLTSGGEFGYLSTSNVAIGNSAGASLNNGAENNVFIGEEAGMSITSFDQNVFIGSGAGRGNGTGYNNIYIGYESGSTGHGQYNVYIGDESGRYSVNGFANVAIGDEAGKNLGGADQNVLIGDGAGRNLGESNANVIIGSGAGSSTNSETEVIGGNVFIGKSAGAANTTGTNNVYIGKYTGLGNIGSSNIFIGPSLVFGNNTLSQKLIIDNGYTSDITQYYLIGDMTWGSRDLRINARTGINIEPHAVYDLNIAGSANAEAWLTDSDEKLKTNIETITEPLKKVTQLRGVSFNWDKEGPANGEKSIGFIAQEAESVIPELVYSESDYYSMNYAPVTALLVEAIKELKKENDELRAELSKIEQLEKELEEIKALIKK